MLDSVLDEPRFRVHWAACLTLLRAVGHVLDKVDSKHSPAVKTAVKAAYQRWKADPEGAAIFWHFIEAERNLVLKEYETRFDLSGFDVVVEDEEGQPKTEWLGPEYYIRITAGPFIAEDARELVRDAIEWWEGELQRIEAA